MELNEKEKKMLFQVEGDYQAKVLNELYMTVRCSNNSALRETAESLMAKVRVLSDRECMDLVRDIQKNYRLPHPPRTIGERIAEARQQSGAEKLKGHDIMGLERFDPEVKHMIVFDVLSYLADRFPRFLNGLDGTICSPDRIFCRIRRRCSPSSIWTGRGCRMRAGCRATGIGLIFHRRVREFVFHAFLPLYCLQRPLFPKFLEGGFPCAIHTLSGVHDDVPALCCDFFHATL